MYLLNHHHCKGKQLAKENRVVHTESNIKLLLMSNLQTETN